MQILTSLNNSTQQPSFSNLATLVTESFVGKKLISRFYNMLTENHKENSENKRLEWIRDLQKDIKISEWSKICLRIHTQTNFFNLIKNDTI